MHKMECENCIHGKRIPNGAYSTVNGTMIMNGKNNIVCMTDVREIKMNGKNLECSEYEARMSAEGTVE